MVNNLEILGHTHNVDKRLFEPVATHMERVGTIGTDRTDFRF